MAQLLKKCAVREWVVPALWRVKADGVSYHDQRLASDSPRTIPLMSQRIYYEIDGHVRGPISLTQLQLMATSGMLLPQHRLRREDTEEWFLAQSVRGLFPTSRPRCRSAGS